MVAERMRAASAPAPPWLLPDSLPDPPDVLVREAPTPAGIGGRRRRILIVDDEPAIVQLLAALLEDEGWTALRASCAEEAWDVVAAQPVDAIICDVSMPRISGLELLRRLRTASLIDGTPFVLMSAAVREIEPDGAIFLPKPFDLDEVLDLLDRLVAR